ncbi:MAG: hypothetical protein J5843_02950, partial [Clostridia bacterium]|nr:hypothetical protein [Clostridia bacterium]
QANRARRLIVLWGEHGTVNAMEVTPEEFKAWDVKRKQMNHAEGERIRNELSLDQLCEEGEYEFPAEPASEGDELHEWLLEAVERLPEDEKKIVKRMYLDDPKGMSDYAVARETGIPRTTVEYALRRAIGRLRADYLRTFTRLTGEN